MTEKTQHKQTRRGVALYVKNPFLAEIMTVTKQVREKQRAKKGWDTKTELLDNAFFVKLFIQGARALKELTGAGIKVFEVMYLAVQANIGKEQISMSFSMVDQVHNPMSNATYDRGIRDLLEKKFLAATPTQGTYWLNPSYVWNGSRLEVLRETDQNGSLL